MTDSDKSRSRLHPEMLVGISAVVIGVCALGVSLYETNLMREEQRAAVIPLVELSRSFFLENGEDEDESLRLILSLENVGIGPARIQDFRVTVDGEPQPTWRATMNALLGEDVTAPYVQSTINGRTIPVDRRVDMFDLRDSGVARRILADFERLDFSACYCSVFDDCWQTSYRTFGAADEVDSCESSADSFTE